MDRDKKSGIKNGYIQVYTVIKNITSSQFLLFIYARETIF